MASKQMDAVSTSLCVWWQKDPVLRQKIQILVIHSRGIISHVLGIVRSSRKKIIEDKKRKMVKKGVKRRVENKLTNEMGRPHATKKGSDIREIKSCS